jgi:hypothetical protein
MILLEIIVRKIKLAAEVNQRSAAAGCRKAEINNTVSCKQPVND